MKNSTFKDKFMKFLSGVKYFFLSIFSFIGKILSHKKGRLGVIIVLFVMFVAIFAPLLTPYDPYGYDVANSLQPPSKEHWIGTDKNGVDIFTQLLYGARLSLVIGIVTGVSVTLFGAVMGVIAGYFGKVASEIILNLINVLMVIPTMPLMIMLHDVSSSYLMMIFVFVAFGWSGTARICRSQVLTVKNMEYVKQAELAGASKWYIMTKHILPSISNILVMSCALSCAGFMIAEAGLSFIGLGDPTKVSWGKVLMSAQESAFSLGRWLWVLSPGIALFITVTGFMNIGYAIEDIFNPRIKIQNDIYKGFYKVKNYSLDKEFEKIKELTKEEATEIFKEEMKNE